MGKQENYNSPFPCRLRGLLETRKITITALAKELNVTRQAVSQYADGSVQPNIEKLVSIAAFFNVSTDYLVGLSDYEQRSTGDLTAADMGIDNDAALQLSKDKKEKSGISGVVLSLLAKSKHFWEFSDAIADYIRSVKHAQKYAHSPGGIYEEKRDVRMKRFILSEQMFECIDDYIQVPNFDERLEEARKRAVNPQKDN